MRKILLGAVAMTGLLTLSALPVAAAPVSNLVTAQVASSHDHDIVKADYYWHRHHWHHRRRWHGGWRYW